MAEKKLKLWVYDTTTLLKVYAESQDGADAQAHQVGELIGVDFELATDWETYQHEDFGGDLAGAWSIAKPDAVADLVDEAVQRKG